MEQSSEKRIELENGEEIFIREEGKEKKQKLLLVHDLLTSSSLFRVVMKLLADDYHCIAPDIRGFGHSSYKHQVERIEDIVDDLQQIIEYKGFSRVSVLACGAMGVVAIMLAKQLGKVIERVVVVSGWQLDKQLLLGYDNNSLQTNEYIDSIQRVEQDIYWRQLLQGQQNRVVMQGLLEQVIFSRQVKDQLLFTHLLDDTVYARAIPHILQALFLSTPTTINQKVLLLTGTHAIFPLSYYQRIKEMIGEQAELKVLKDCGTFPFLDDYQKFFEAVAKFLQFKVFKFRTF